MLNYVVDTGAYWTDADGGAAMDTPQMIEALTHWKTVLAENLTPLNVGSGEARQMLAEGKVAMHFDGPWIWGIVRGAAPDVFAQLKFAPVPFNTPVGGSSNVIAMNSGIDDARKQLVWDFIAIITSQEFQRSMRPWAGSRRRAPTPCRRTSMKRSPTSICWWRRPRRRPRPESTVCRRGWRPCSTSSLRS